MIPSTWGTAGIRRRWATCYHKRDVVCAACVADAGVAVDGDGVVAYAVYAGTVVVDDDGDGDDAAAAVAVAGDADDGDDDERAADDALSEDCVANAADEEKTDDARYVDAISADATGSAADGVVESDADEDAAAALDHGVAVTASERTKKKDK